MSSIIAHTYIIQSVSVNERPPKDTSMVSITLIDEVGQNSAVNVSYKEYVASGLNVGMRVTNSLAKA